jgi:hypothetical protein
MRRALVLSHEAAGHSFRRSLPASAFSTSDWDEEAEEPVLFIEPQHDIPLTAPSPEVIHRLRWKPSENTTFFATSFVAGFVTFYSFIV